MKNSLWIESYRPKTIDEYVFPDSYQEEQIRNWIKDGSIPHLLLTGDPGVGKTTLARLLISELDIEEYDTLVINASRENGVDIVRNKINTFAQTIPFGKFKIILLDEADHTSSEFQAALRNDMEAYHMTCRFILTCNYPNRIIPALKSRCHTLNIAKTDITEFTARAAKVLLAENVSFELDVLDTYVRATYPDLRKCLNQLQVNSTRGTLQLVENSVSDENHLLVQATKLFKEGKVIEGRQQLLHYIGLHPSQVENVYRWMYDNLDLWGKTNEKRDASIIIIRNGLANLSLVGIPEINLAATLIELTS